MYWDLLVALSLSAFVLVHTAMGLVSIVSARVLERRLERWSPRTAACVILTLRVLPFVIAIASVALLITPAFLLHEPNSAGESITWKLGALSAAAVALLVHAHCRIALTWLATRRAVSRWSKTAMSMPDAGVELPVLCFESSVPMMAVVGVWRPRMFVSHAAVAMLAPEEFRAALQHELAHHRARDLWKQWAVRCLPDLVPGGRFTRLQRLFQQKTEEAADHDGVHQDRSQAIALASALVKFARATALHEEPEAVGAYLLPKSSDSELAQRVLRLTRTRMPDPAPITDRRERAAVILALSALVVALVPYAELLEHTHELLELLVR
ncbi:MAG: hypothetical protein HYX26_00810 [Acidobacteriales bacterium]|nr:hypothetical protein [Terriglobales bacterium]